MTKSKNTKRALLMSVLSMMLCVAMLVGSTFAWFTDSVTSGKNRIVAGNLDVELEYAELDENGNVKLDGEGNVIWKSVEGESLFDENALWEPGYTQIVYLKVRNAGTLALKYKLAVNVVGEITGINEKKEVIKLSEHLVFGKAESDTMTTYATREDAWKAVGSTQGLNDYAKDSELAVGAEEYVALVVYMPTTVGNEANYRGDTIPAIELGINLVATQNAVEKDSFDENYDSDLEYPKLPAAINTTVEATIASGGDTVLKDELLGVTATIPENSLDEDVTNVTLRIETEECNVNSVTYEISLVDQDGKEVESSEQITVTLPIGKGLKNVKVNHNGEPMDSADYSYNSATGVVTIKTTSFSPFTIMFEQVNPGEPWDGSVDTEGLVENTNADEKTITIATPGQLAALAEQVNSGNDLKGYTIELVNNLKLGGREWTPIGTGSNYFRGTFDGKNHTISGLTITGNNDKVGLIGNFNGTIKDLTLTDVNISGRDNVAVVAAFSGYTDKNGIVSNVDVKKAVITGGHYVGTIFGYGYGWSTISDCDVEDVTITVTPYLVNNEYDNGDKVGGLVGFTGDGGSNKIINNTVTKATITAYRDIGGLVGYSYTDTISGNKVTDVQIIVSKVNDYGKPDLRAGEITGNRGLLDNEATNVTIVRPD